MSARAAPPLRALLRALVLAAGTLAAAAACGEEEPTGLGKELLPEDAIRTFEVVLEPEQYLVLDTSFSGYGLTRGAAFAILARDYEGALDAHIPARYRIPTTIVVRDTGTTFVTDSFPTIVGGELIMLVDTVGSDADGAVQVAAHRVAEAWNPEGTSWIYRDTTAGALVPWSVPGGTPGAEISTTTWAPGDSIILPVDTATLRTWADTLDATRGVLIRIVDGTGRLRTTAPVLRVRARSSLRDTTVTVTTTPTVRDFIYTPTLPTRAPDIRSGGLPGWRGFLHFRPDLAELVIDCGPGCAAPLRRFHITRAELLLRPTAPPPGFRPEVAIGPTAYLGLVSPEVPLPRTLLGSSIGTVSAPIEPERFVVGADPVRLAVTPFLDLALADSTGTDAESFRPEWLVITPGAQVTFGFGIFEPGPRLRLVLSTAQENQLP